MTHFPTRICVGGSGMSGTIWQIDDTAIPSPAMPVPPVPVSLIGERAGRIGMIHHKRSLSW